MNLQKRILMLALMLMMSIATFAQEEGGNHAAAEGSGADFNAGPFIMNHIGDSYEWHIATFGDFHLSLPLPCILYSGQSGFHLFSSSNFHHGHAEYEGFKIGDNGKIVEVSTGERPWDFSITKNVVAMFFSMILICFMFIGMKKYYAKNVGKAPHGFYNALEIIVLFVRDDIAYASLGKKNGDKFMPFLMTVFFFIFINNLLGLIPIIPGGANLTGNIAVTCVLALFTFFITTFSGNKEYWQDIFWPHGVPLWLNCPPIIPIVELMGVFTKPIVLMVRLFANITAGHIIALSFYSLIFIFGAKSAGVGYGVAPVSVAFTIFMSVLELLVAFIQAYVFTLLSSIYFSMAIGGEHEEKAVEVAH
ncbi:MAG: F0F1 ATP synthase subunit A [Bacteroidales bacterium]|nr:F0F1 ATP synthase subunit A [Bacteroidales bacterium]